MVDFSFFDSIMDQVFVIDKDGKIVYCNETAATFAATSVRRVAGKAMLSELMEIKEPGILPFTPESHGRNTPSPFIETELVLLKAGRKAKGQIAIRPLDENHWMLSIRDVSLEEVLAEKYRLELAKTEEYARNLEKLVEARTAELALVNQTLKAILNSLGQGFFTFNPAGECGSVFTKACEEVLEGIPTGRKAWEVLHVPSIEEDQFKKWCDSMFKELLPFDDMKALGPNLFPHSQKKHVVLEYYPIRRNEAISDVVVVATDKTTEFEAQKALEHERQYAGMIVKYMKNKDQFLSFLGSVRQSLRELFDISSKPMALKDVNESYRILHTLEGEAGTFSLQELRALSRASQQVFEPHKGENTLPAEAQAEYVKSLNAIKTQFEEFLIQNQEIFKVPEGEVSRSVEVSVDGLNGFLAELRRLPQSTGIAGKFEEQFLKVPVENTLKYYDSLIQAVAEKLGKKVNPLKIDGGGVRIFPEPYQKLLSSLVHAFRNAVDHGLESPDEREWGGKNPAGTLSVQVSAADGMFKLVISDDGKGIDPALIREKMKTKFPDKEFTSQSDDEIIQLVSMPGFSSRDSVGEFSGRGVGLDALREEVLRLGGQMHIQSRVGQGTSITLTIPQLGYEPALLRSA
jgi:two-component system chemotaxis sensor kinase CheA